MQKAARNLLFVGVASAALSTAAYAQADGGVESTVGAVQDDEQPAAEADGISSGNAIIVTARRRGERLQDVPQTVNAISDETIEKLRINDASDIAQVVPGISIESSTSGSGSFGASSSIRGVPTFLNANASPIVQFYLNDAPTGRGPEVTQTLFDIGQVSVLKGPQGTLRGRSAPGGAITLTTRQPDLYEVGGFANMSGTDRGQINLQSAVGAPIIDGKLAFRVAAALDHNEANGVTSANNGVDPFVKSEAVRASLLFEPTANLTANLMYQKLWQNRRTFSQVAGDGNVVNGPRIDRSDRLGITDQPGRGDINFDFLVGGIDWSLGGHKLSYIGSFRKSHTITASPQDIANVVPGVEFFQVVDNDAEETSHELRLSSEDRVLGMFDYVVGAFYDKEKSSNLINRPAAFLSGAFGAPGSLSVAQDPLDRYTLDSVISVNPSAVEKSVFGNVTAHLTDKTELAVGGRYINFKRRDQFTLDLLGGFNAIANPTGGALACEALGPFVTSPVYAGACDVPVPGDSLQDVDSNATFNSFVYNVSLSHRFSPDFMVYGNVGTAVRTAGPAIGFTSVLSCCGQAGGHDFGSIEDLVIQDEKEKSTAYELGFKATFLDQRARLNVAIFQQDFDNYFFLTQPTRYLSITDPSNPGASTVSSAEFTAAADATVKGIDIEAGFQVTPRWDVNLGFSWAKAKLDDALVPCNDSDFDGEPDNGTPTAADFVANRTIVARCVSNESISRTPRWNLSLQSEYSAPLTSSLDGFIRGNVNYYPDNPNASTGFVIDNYALVDMYLGLRSPDNAWEVSAFANNLLNEQQVLSFNPVRPVSAGGAGSFFGIPEGNYREINYTPRREFGLLVRYAFGSR